MQPPAEHVHWLFATGFLLLGLCLLARAFVGAEVWDRRAWRAYLWPSLLFGLGLFMWPVMVFFTNSSIHMVAHGAWAQTMMLAGAERPDDDPVPEQRVGQAFGALREPAGIERHEVAARLPYVKAHVPERCRQPGALAVDPHDLTLVMPVVE